MTPTEREAIRAADEAQTKGRWGGGWDLTINYDLLFGLRYEARMVADNAVVAYYLRGVDRMRHITDALTAADRLAEVAASIRSKIDRMNPAEEDEPE